MKIYVKTSNSALKANSSIFQKKLGNIRYTLYILFWFLLSNLILLGGRYRFPQRSLQNILKTMRMFSKYRMFLTLRK